MKSFLKVAFGGVGPKNQHFQGSKIRSVSTSVTVEGVSEPHSVQTVVEGKETGKVQSTEARVRPSEGTPVRWPSGEGRLLPALAA